MDLQVLAFYSKGLDFKLKKDKIVRFETCSFGNNTIMKPFITEDPTHKCVYV